MNEHSGAYRDKAQENFFQARRALENKNKGAWVFPILFIYLLFNSGYKKDKFINRKFFLYRK